MTQSNEISRQSLDLLIKFFAKEYFSYTDLFVTLINTGKVMLNADFGIICSRQENIVKFLYATKNQYFESKSEIFVSDFNNYNIFLPQNETITAEIRINPNLNKDGRLSIKEKLSYISTPVFLLNKAFAHIIFFKKSGYFSDNDYAVSSNLSMFLSGQMDKLTSLKKYVELKNSSPEPDVQHAYKGADENLTRFIKKNFINSNNNGMENNNQDLLDLNIIQSLKELGGEGDPGFLKEVIELYLEQAPGLLNDIRNSCSENNAEKLARSAHALKGASLNIGAKKFAEICRELEFKGKENDFSGIEILIREFEDNFIETSSVLKKIIQ